MKSLLLLICLFAVTTITRADLPQPDPDNGGLTLPPGFHALVVADNLGPLRFITVAPNGDIYIKKLDEEDVTKSNQGLVALHDSKGDGRADVVQTFCSSGPFSGGGTGCCVHNGYLYFSTNDAVYRYKLTPGKLVPTGDPEPIVIGLPPGQQEHEAKAFAFDGSGNLFVEVGCPSNGSGDPDRGYGAKGVDPTELFKQHGGFWRFKADVPNQDQVANGYHFSTGLRHVISVAWNEVSKSFFVVMNGRDQLSGVDPKDYTDEDNAEIPAEEMHLLQKGSNFGWPFTYWDPLKKARMISPEFGGDNKKTDDSHKYPDPLVAFPAHWAPLQMTFYTGTQFPEKYRNGAFIAFHGSWNRAPLPQAGYKIAYAPFDEKGMPLGTYETFADNFSGKQVLMSPRRARYRPCGVAQGPDGSLYVTDTEKGRVWRIIYTGESTDTSSPPSPPIPAKTSS